MARACPFCERDNSRVFHEGQLVVGLWDGFPVAPGHALLVPRRHVATWFEASDEERAELSNAIAIARAAIEAAGHEPDGYNIGINVGAAAGQTVPHLHVHVIPRHHGDVDDPTGGVRHVIPSKGNYLAGAQTGLTGAKTQSAASHEHDMQLGPLTTGGESDPFARQMLPMFDWASEIAIVSAFVQESGLRRIGPAVSRALARGARIRLITGDYLEITQVGALEQLLDWQNASALGDDDDEPASPRGRLEARVVEVGALAGRTRSFHPKSWRFESSDRGSAFVGSSNLSLSALDTGIEWNLRVGRSHDRRAYDAIRTAFEDIWSQAQELTSDWVEAYAVRTRHAAQPLPVGEVEPAELERAHDPHEVQLEALEKLREARAQGRTRALVVMATGLGKTWLAALDYRQLAEEMGSRPRLLFLAHRRELLTQAANAYRRMLRARGEHARLSWFLEERSDLSGSLVFASVAKLARAAYLERLKKESFDYVVVDEVHHAAADSYRRILDATDPRFLLGLTATPERADAADVLGLFDDFLAFRADIGRGIQSGMLVPFHYYGVKDEIDYTNIPWRNRRFDPEQLAAAAQTEARMQTLWRAWCEHAGSRSLVFCCSIAHADFVRSWLSAHGLRVAAVYSARGSDDRDASLKALAEGAIDALCAVDVFNEGIDVRPVDRVVMLRPTESPVVFMQQLGRGLRVAQGKQSLTVIDFVGNHGIFLERVRLLLSLAGREPRDLRATLAEPGPVELPAGCSVELELESKELLRRLFRSTGADEVERAYRELRAERGGRPRAGELQRMGYLLSTLRKRHGSWFDFVRSEGNLSEDETGALEEAGAFLRELETTEMTKCFKMVTLEVLLEEDALGSGMALETVSRRSHARLRRSPELYEDVAAEVRFDALTIENERAWHTYWQRNPIAAWTSKKKDGRRIWFALENDRLAPRIPVAADRLAALTGMARELVDYRLAEYRTRKRLGAVAEGFECRVTWNQRDPILKLPARRLGAVPQGETDVRLPDGAVWQFRFAKEFCNVARPVGSQRNLLPDLLRRWFGPRAGQPGTRAEVRFRASTDGLWIEPAGRAVVDLASFRRVTAYADLRAAAGHAVAEVEAGAGEPILLPLELDDEALFAVRVSGSSMDGGKSPLRDGDWAVMRPCRGATAAELSGQVVLAQTPGEASGALYQIKRLVRRAQGWLLASDSPEGPSFAPKDDVIAVAKLVRAVRPEDLGPPLGALVGEDELAAVFGIAEILPRTGRHGGHLFLFVDREGGLGNPGRIHLPVPDRRPSETAYALAKQGERTWRYLGVARWNDADGRWHVPEVDTATWRTWGDGPSASG